MPTPLTRAKGVVTRSSMILSKAGRLSSAVTLRSAHEDYHIAREMGINVIAGGHYETETVGVSLVMEKVKAETGLECIFIDIPTGL